MQCNDSSHFRIDACSTDVESSSEKQLEQLSENLELDSMFDLMCNNVDKVLVELIFRTFFPIFLSNTFGELK